jgi:predicted MPP superfamily phosphohydrolase
MMTRRRFLRVAGLGAGLAAGAGFYTWRVEPDWLEVVERRLPVANLPDRLVGCRLAQLTDLHIGRRVDDAYLIRSFELVKELSPEFVVYTGDFTSYEAGIFGHAERVLARAALGRLATLGVLGNHDYGPGWSHPEVAARIAEVAAAAGVRILRNEVAEVNGLQMVGLDDLWAGRGQPKAGLALLHPGRAAVVLTHNPDSADLEGWDGYSGWILAGHTHGGQCKPPFLPPPCCPSAIAGTPLASSSCLAGAGCTSIEEWVIY